MRAKRDADEVVARRLANIGQRFDLRATAHETYQSLNHGAAQETFREKMAMRRAQMAQRRRVATQELDETREKQGTTYAFRSVRQIEQPPNERVMDKSEAVRTGVLRQPGCAWRVSEKMGASPARRQRQLAAIAVTPRGTTPRSPGRSGQQQLASSTHAKTAPAGSPVGIRPASPNASITLSIGAGNGSFAQAPAASPGERVSRRLDSSAAASGASPRPVTPQPACGKPAGQRGSRSRSPSGISDEAYRRLSNCGNFRPVLRAISPQPSPTASPAPVAGTPKRGGKFSGRA